MDELLGSFGAAPSWSGGAKTNFDPLSGGAAKFDPLKGLNLGMRPSSSPGQPDAKPAGGSGPSTRPASAPAPARADALSVTDAASLIRTSGVRDFVESQSSGYNTLRKPGSRPRPARPGPASSAGLGMLSEESSRSASDRDSPRASPPPPPAGVLRRGARAEGEAPHPPLAPPPALASRCCALPRAARRPHLAPCPF
jgi:hypothetical protein